MSCFHFNPTTRPFCALLNYKNAFTRKCVCVCVLISTVETIVMQMSKRRETLKKRRRNCWIYLS